MEIIDKNLANAGHSIFRQNASLHFIKQFTKIMGKCGDFIDLWTSKFDHEYSNIIITFGRKKEEKKKQIRKF